MTAPPPPPIHILLVEDDAADAQFVIDALTREAAGYHVTAVDSAEAALGTLAGAPFDLVLADYRLPGQDGLALLRQVRQVAPHLPVVLLTGYPTPSVRQAATLLGASGFLLKPVTPAALREAMRAALRP